MTTAFGQVDPGRGENIQDAPVNLQGVYNCPGNGNTESTSPGYARDNTDSEDWTLGVESTDSQNYEFSGGLIAKDGEFDPLNNSTKYPMFQVEDLTGHRFQFEIDLEPVLLEGLNPVSGGNPISFNGPMLPVVDLENATFGIGCGDELSNDVGEANGEVEISATGTPGTASYSYVFAWRSGSAVTTPIAIVPTVGGLLPTQWRIRVVFAANGLTAVAVLTPMNNVVGNVVDIISGVLPVVANSNGNGRPLTATAFVAGFVANGPMCSSRGQVAVRNFVTSAGDNQMWMMSQNQNKSTNPLAYALIGGAGFGYDGTPPGLPGPGPTTPGNGLGDFNNPFFGSARSDAVYMDGMSNPTSRVFAWQALIDPFNALGGAQGNGYTPLIYAGPAGCNFLPGQPIFDVVFLAPWDGTDVVDAATVAAGFANGVIKKGAFSAGIMSNPAGTNESHFLATQDYGLQVFENTEAPFFLVVTDPDAPAGYPDPVLTTLQGVGHANIPTTLRNAMFTLVGPSTTAPQAPTSTWTITDNTPPRITHLEVIQDSIIDPMELHQGPISFSMDAQDFGLPAAVPTNEGSGLQRYPRLVARPASDTSIAPGVHRTDFDMSRFVYPQSGNTFCVQLSIGGTGLCADSTLDIPCGQYHFVAWAQDRVGLVSTPSTVGSVAGGWNGATPLTRLFDVEKFEQITLNLHFDLFAGIAPDPVHAASGPGGTPQFQRWVIITLGGPPGSGGTFAPIHINRFVLLNATGDGTVVLTDADTDIGEFFCPQGDFCVSVKDPEHSLRRTLSLTCDTTNMSNFTGNFTGTKQLLLGDYDNDNRIGIDDFGVFLANYGVIYPQNDITNFVLATHVDGSGNRRVGFEDYLNIANHNNIFGDADCGRFNSRTSGNNNGYDKDKVLVTKLLAMGIKEARRYDFNHDGWVTWSEMQKVLALKTLGKW